MRDLLKVLLPLETREKTLGVALVRRRGLLVA